MFGEYRFTAVLRHETLSLPPILPRWLYGIRFQSHRTLRGAAHAGSAHANGDEVIPDETTSHHVSGANGVRETVHGTVKFLSRDFVPSIAEAVERYV